MMYGGYDFDPPSFGELCWAVLVLGLGVAVYFGLMVGVLMLFGASWADVWGAVDGV